MSKTVIAVHAVIHVPEGEKSQKSVAPGTKFKISDDDYASLKPLGAIKDVEAPAKSDVEAPKVETKPTKAAKPAVDDVVG